MISSSQSARLDCALDFELGSIDLADDVLLRLGLLGSHILEKNGWGEILLAAVDGTVHSGTLGAFLFGSAHETLVELLLVFATYSVLKNVLSLLVHCFLYGFVVSTTNSSVVEGVIYSCLALDLISLRLSVDACQNCSVIWASIFLLP